MTKTTNWDAVAASAPLDVTAARVMGAVGEPSAFRKKVIGETYRRDFAPPKVKPREVIRGVNLTGLVVGRLTVIGLADLPERNKKRNAAWVVRCVCGAYEMRTARALRNPEYVPTASCSHCNYLRKLKAGKTRPVDIIKKEPHP